MRGDRGVAPSPRRVDGQISNFGLRIHEGYPLATKAPRLEAAAVDPSTLLAIVGDAR
jgi:hypothetical protein